MVLVLFDYHHGLGREGPEGILKDNTGFGPTDKYNVYEIFEQMHKIIH